MMFLPASWGAGVLPQPNERRTSVRRVNPRQAAATGRRATDRSMASQGGNAEANIKLVADAILAGMPQCGVRGI